MTSSGGGQDAFGSRGPGAAGAPEDLPRGSLLAVHATGPADGEPIDPEVAADLNLDRVARSIVADREEPDFLTRTFCRPLRDVDAVRDRQEIFRDLEAAALRECLGQVCAHLRGVRAQLDQVATMGCPQQRDGWFLDAVLRYCAAVSRLAAGLSAAEPASPGLRAVQRSVTAYVASPAFATLWADSRSCREALDEVRYCIHIRGTRVRVSRYEGEADYSAEVEATFDRFQQGAPTDYRVTYRAWPALDHIGVQILTRVARLFPAEFDRLAAFAAAHATFYEPAVRTFEREIQFFLAYLDYVAPMRAAGLDFCYPDLSANDKQIVADATFDLALADQLVAANREVVRNDVRLCGPERVIVVTGPNQGGKTTFARSVGQLYHLAALGCPVPGTAARLLLCDRIFTHFEKAEDPTELMGKLEEDLRRIQQVLQAATPRSIVVLNELFASTTLVDARFLGTTVLRRLISLDVLCVCVTFVDELASLGPSVVSMVSTVVPEDPSERTYRVVRAPADGLAYALAIAEKYQLTYEHLRRRLARRGLASRGLAR